MYLWIQLVAVYTFLAVCSAGPIFTTTEEAPIKLPDIPNILGDPLQFTFDQQKLYLERYAYLGRSSPDISIRLLSITNPKKAFKKAVKKFQRAAGLQDTGTVDDETKIMMMWPRCGLPDNVTQNDELTTRKKRFFVHIDEGWNRRKLTYKIVNTPKNTLKIKFSSNGSEIVKQAKPSDVKKALKRAFKTWSKVSKLKFTKVKKGSKMKADINIRFVERQHGDGLPFDGANGQIAHAFYPIGGGNIHFDNTEAWAVDESGRNGYDVFQVAVHEIGHALGLGHQRNIPESIMYPFYIYRPDFKLHSDDKAGIRYLYN